MGFCSIRDIPQTNNVSLGQGQKIGSYEICTEPRTKRIDEETICAISHQFVMVLQNEYLIVHCNLLTCVVVVRLFLFAFEIT